MKRVMKLNRDKTLGWEWSDVGNWFSEVGSQTADQLSTQLPKELANQLQTQLLPGQTVTQSGTTYNVQTPVPAPTTTYVQQAASAMNVPPAVIYGMAGLMGVGVLLALIKALK